jgi:hypothetical protein
MYLNFLNRIIEVDFKNLLLCSLPELWLRRVFLPMEKFFAIWFTGKYRSGIIFHKFTAAAGFIETKSVWQPGRLPALRAEKGLHGRQ